MEPKALLGASKRTVTEWRDHTPRLGDDMIAEEVPVAMIYNGISHAVMMASPIDLEAFAFGFSLTEGIIDHPNQIYHVDIRRVAEGIELVITLSSRQFDQLKRRRRALVGPSGCGLCGTETLDQVHRSVSPLPSQGHLVSHHAIQLATNQLMHHQSLQQSTGAVHGAAWCSLNGEIAMVCEDVGRHNALDKLIGQRAQLPGFLDEPGFLLMSSRASFEIVQKAAIAGIGLIVTISGPSSLAVDLAAKSGITLVGFSRQARHVVYSHPDRLLEENVTRKISGSRLTSPTPH